MKTHMPDKTRTDFKLKFVGGGRMEHRYQTICGKWVPSYMFSPKRGYLTCQKCRDKLLRKLK